MRNESFAERNPRCTCHADWNIEPHEICKNFQPDLVGDIACIGDCKNCLHAKECHFPTLTERKAEAFDILLQAEMDARKVPHHYPELLRRALKAAREAVEDNQ